MVAAAQTEAQKVELYTASRLTIDPDTRAERGYLDLLAGRLQLPDALVDHVEATVVGAKVPAAAPQPRPIRAGKRFGEMRAAEAGRFALRLLLTQQAHHFLSRIGFPPPKPGSRSGAVANDRPFCRARRLLALPGDAPGSELVCDAAP